MRTVEIGVPGSYTTMVLVLDEQDVQRLREGMVIQCEGQIVTSALAMMTEATYDQAVTEMQRQFGEVAVEPGAEPRTAKVS